MAFSDLEQEYARMVKGLADVVDKGTLIVFQ